MDPDHDLERLSLPGDWSRSHAAFKRLARAVLGDDGLSEDAVQSAYVSALRAPGRTRSARWWQRAVRSRAIDDARRRGAERPAPGAVPVERCAPAADEIASRLELQREVVRAVEELDDPYRETVYLRFFEESTPTEIAERLGVPVKTVKTRLTRGVAKLRERLGERGDGDDWRGRLAAIAMVPSTPGAHVAAAAAFESSSILPSLQLGAASALVGMKKIVVCLVLAAIAALTWTFAPPFLDAPIDADARPSTIDTGALTSVADPELAVPDERAGGARSVGSSAPEVATAEAAAPTGSGQLRVVVTWPEGDPAPGVGLLIHTGSRPGYDVRNGTLVETDASGVAVVDDLSPGPVEVRAFRSAEERLARGEISSGATTELACVLSESIRVTGVVEDTNGSPVAHADVWLTSRAPGILGGRIVGRADSDGRFELRHVPRTQSIGAIAEGFAPSELTDLDLVDLSESPVALRLVLAPDGAALRGVVLDEAGDPVADARVAVRSPFPETRSMHPNGSMSERWTPRTGETDGAGRFSFAGLYPGTTRVEVLAEGRPLWLDEVDLERGATVEIVVPLEVGAVVRGVLRDAEGDPVADGRVVAYRDAIEERFLPVGQLPGNGASFGRDMAWTDASGAFVLEGLAPGEAHLYAQPPRDPGRRMGEVVLWDSTILTLSPGDDVVWDARLGAGLSITGRVGYADGTPMPGVFVSARDSESDKEFATFTEDGTFEFVRLSAVPHEVRVQLQDPPPNSAPLVVDGVMPGGAPIELLADFGPPGSTEPARISVVFDDGADRAGDVRAILSLEFVDGVSWERGTPDGDRWSFEQPYPGRCRVVAFAGERLIAATDVFEVDHGDDIDLGTLATKPGGSLSITVDRAEGTDLYELHGLLKHAGSFRWHAFAPGRSSSIRLDGLEPGEHQLRLMSQRGVRIHRAITIEPGRETSLSVELVEGVEVPYEITWDADDPPERLRYSARTAAGEVFLDRTWGDLGPSEGKIEHRVFAPIGVHTFEATADDGRRAETTFQVGADGAAGPVETIRVEL